MAINGSGGVGNLWNGMGGGNMSFRLRTDRTPIVTGAEMAMTKWAGGGFNNNMGIGGYAMMNMLPCCTFAAIPPWLVLGGYSGSIPYTDTNMTSSMNNMNGFPTGSLI